MGTYLHLCIYGLYWQECICGLNQLHSYIVKILSLIPVRLKVIVSFQLSLEIDNPKNLAMSSSCHNNDMPLRLVIILSMSFEYLL